MLRETSSNTIINALTGRSTDSLISPGTSYTYRYLALSTTTPEVGSSGSIDNFTEPDSSTGYERQLIGYYSSSTTIAQKFASADGGTTSNTSAIFFPEATEGGGGYGTITHIGIYASTSQSATAGTLIYAYELTEAVEVPEGYVPTFSTGALSFTME